MAQKRILCVGNAVWDQIFIMESLPVGAGKYFARTYIESGGGPAATAAVAISRLGGAAKVWSRIGDDSPGDRIVAELESYGVEVPDLDRIKGVASSLAGIYVDDTGERIIVSYLDDKFPQGAEWLPLEEVREYDCVLGDIRWPAGTEAVLKAAAEYGVPSVLDADRVPTREILHRLAPLASHAVFSEGGLQMYTGEHSPEAGLEKAAVLIKGIPFVTLGGDGCMWMRDGRLERLAAFPVSVADTTGAGDVFHGAFALALAEKMTLVDAARFASATAALKCTKPGGRAGIPDRAALEGFLEKK